MALGHPGPAPHSREGGNPYGGNDGEIDILRSGAYRRSLTGSMGPPFAGTTNLMSAEWILAFAGMTTEAT